MGNKKRTARRIEAAHAAATVFAGTEDGRIEELWSLTVFFDRFIRHGAKGTLEDFGPTEPEAATVLHLVGDNRAKWFRP